jgi:hypothetical protein
MEIERVREREIIYEVGIERGEGDCQELSCYTDSCPAPILSGGLP